VRYFELREGEDTASTACEVLVCFVDLFFHCSVNWFRSTVVIDEAAHVNYTVRGSLQAHE